MSHLCDRFGIQFLNEMTSKEDWLEASYMGLGLCIDSLHPESKAKIDLTVDNDFDKCILIVDECEQVVSHLLHSSTLKSKRAEINSQLKIVKTLQKFIWLTLNYLIFTLISLEIWLT